MLSIAKNRKESNFPGHRISDEDGCDRNKDDCQKPESEAKKGLIEEVHGVSIIACAPPPS